MKICAVQTRPLKGDVAGNIANHEKLIGLAVAHSADIIIFPELSITGYEPELAKKLATGKDDSCFDTLQAISDEKNVTLGVGMPVKSGEWPMIGMIIFQPWKQRQLYCKQYLHSDELPFFVSGKDQVFVTHESNKLALSICYELSIPEHSADAFRNGANIYVSSVAKTAIGVEKAVETLGAIAKRYSMMVVMANCIGSCDNFESAGKTSAWNKQGQLIGQLDSSHEGILIVDTITGEVIKKMP